MGPFSRFVIMSFVNSALSKAGVGLLGASQSIKANLAKQTTTVSEAYYKKSGFDFTNFVGNQLKTMPERWAVARKEGLKSRNCRWCDEERGLRHPGHRCLLRRRDHRPWLYHWLRH